LHVTGAAILVSRGMKPKQRPRHVSLVFGLGDEETRMTLNVCPADTVQAPVEKVWELLMQPADYGQFWEWQVERVEPAGPATVGQKIFGWTPKVLGWRWRIDGEIQEVDTQRHEILFRVSLMWGLLSSNRIMCARIDDHHCTLRYG
jgi:hypothetical protein